MHPTLASYHPGKKSNNKWVIESILLLFFKIFTSQSNTHTINYTLYIIYVPVYKKKLKYFSYRCMYSHWNSRLQTCISNICTSVGVFVPMSEDTDWKPCKRMQYLHVSLFLYTICNTCTIPEMNWQYGAYLLTNPYIKLFHGVPLTLF